MFIQVRSLLDEVFGVDNFFSLITVKRLSPLGTSGMANVADYILWYCRNKNSVNFRPVFDMKPLGSESRYDYLEMPNGHRRKMTSDELSAIDSISNT